MFIITGASDGLGLEIAKLALAKGKRAISLSRSKPPVDEIGWVQADLMDEALISSAVEKLLGMSEPIEALVNCAAVVSYESADALTPGELDKMFKTNVTGPMLLTSKLLPRLKQDGSDIVNVGATIALKAGYGDQTTYSTTKWALRGFSKNLSEELKPTPCRVIDFLLGGFRSNLHTKVTGQPITDPENWMRPEDIAAFMLQILELPKNMEISEVVVNRKTRR